MIKVIDLSGSHFWEPFQKCIGENGRYLGDIIFKHLNGNSMWTLYFKYLLAQLTEYSYFKNRPSFLPHPVLYNVSIMVLYSKITKNVCFVFNCYHWAFLRVVLPIAQISGSREQHRTEYLINHLMNSVLIGWSSHWMTETPASSLFFRPSWTLFMVAFYAFSFVSLVVLPLFSGASQYCADNPYRVCAKILERVQTARFPGRVLRTSYDTVMDAVGSPRWKQQQWKHTRSFESSYLVSGKLHSIWVNIQYVQTMSYNMYGFKLHLSEPWCRKKPAQVPKRWRFDSIRRASTILNLNYGWQHW